MISLLDILAAVAYLLTDVCALLSVLGSAVVLLGTTIAAALGRRFRAPEQILLWSGGGLLFGTAGFLLLSFSPDYPPEPSVWLGYSRATIGWFLFLSFLLLAVSKLVAAKVTPASNNLGSGKAARRNPF
jgi:hypothetical protein